jgi:hypothetical protein
MSTAFAALWASRGTIAAPDLREFLIVSSVSLCPKKSSLTVPRLRPDILSAPTSNVRCAYASGALKVSLLRLVLFSIISTRPGDLYAIQDDLGFIKLQIAGLPTRERGLARRDAAARAPP